MTVALPVTHAHLALHGGEADASGDAGYQGVEKRPQNRDRDVDWHVAIEPGKRCQLDKVGTEEATEKHKASLRAKVEHPFLVREAPLRLFQGALSGLGKEHATHRDAARLRQPAPRRSVRGQTDVGVVAVETATGGEDVSRVPLFAPNRCQTQMPAETSAALHSNTANCRRCSDLP